MLTVTDGRRAEGSLLNWFMALKDGLEAMDKRRNQAKKTLEAILDMSTQKNVLMKRLDQGLSPRERELYEETISKIDLQLVDSLTELQNTHNEMTAISSNFSVISIQLRTLSSNLDSDKSDFSQQSPSHLPYLKSINTLIHYSYIAASDYPKHLRLISKIIHTIQEKILKGRNGDDFRDVRYGLLLWVYEPIVRQGIYEGVREALVDLHEGRAALAR